MGTKTETQEATGEVCFTLKASLDTMRLPVNIPDDAWKIVDIIAYSLDQKYHKRVHICLRGSEVEATISNEYISHIDVCMDACLDAFATAGCKKEGVATTCYAHCRKLIRQDAYNSLHTTYLKLMEELEKLGYKYTAKFGDEDVPQSLNVSVWF
jgi:hypothetical protein